MSENITLSKEDLKELLRSNAEILKEVVQELKKPSEMEQRQLDEAERQRQQDLQMRKDQAQQVIQQMENKKATQRICSHKHRDGNSHCVFVNIDKQVPYILCQRNQCKIYPDMPEDQRPDKNAIYDTVLFNRLFQELPSNDLFQ